MKPPTLRNFTSEWLENAKEVISDTVDWKPGWKVWPLALLVLFWLLITAPFAFCFDWYYAREEYRNKFLSDL